MVTVIPADPPAPFLAMRVTSWGITPFSVMTVLAFLSNPPTYIPTVTFPLRFSFRWISPAMRFA